MAEYNHLDSSIDRNEHCSSECVKYYPEYHKSLGTNRLQYPVKSIPNSAICPEIICPEGSFIRRDDGGNCGCSGTGPTSNCDFIKCATGHPIKNPVTGHCLCPFPHPILNLPQPNCVGIACPLGGTATYNNTLNSCSCPAPPCATKCYDGYRTGFDSTTGACTCIKEPLCPHDIVFCLGGLSWGFSEVTLTCGCFPGAPETPQKSALHQAPLKACSILCREGSRLDTDTCTCIPIRPCDILCREGTKLDIAACTCTPIDACSIQCKDGFKLDTSACTCVPVKPCSIQCKDGFELDTSACTCVPIKACSIRCKDDFKLDTATCTCLPIKACSIRCKAGFRIDPSTCTCVPQSPRPPPIADTPPSPSSLPTPSGTCSTFAPCPAGQFTAFAPFTLQCGCTDCSALHCPDAQLPLFDPLSQKCYCEGVPGVCFDVVCAPPGQQLMWQSVKGADGEISEGCTCQEVGV
jgi:hypothetical protein